MACLEVSTGAPGVGDAIGVKGEGMTRPAGHTCDSLVFEKSDLLRRVEELLCATDSKLAKTVAAPGEHLSLGR